VRHAVELLKPGGYIQWIEPDHVVDAAIITSLRSELYQHIQPDYSDTSGGVRPDHSVANGARQLDHSVTDGITQPDHTTTDGDVPPASLMNGHTKEGPGSTMKHLFDFSLRHAVRLHWDRETRFALSLLNLLHSANIQSVQEEIVPVDWTISTDPRSRAIATENTLAMFRHALVELSDRGETDGELGLYEMNDVERILREAREELEGGTVYRYWLHCVVGRKGSLNTM